MIRVRFDGGRPVAAEDFLTGFLAQDGRTHTGRPVGLAAMPDGAILAGDDTNGVIYRVSRTETTRAAR